MNELIKIIAHDLEVDSYEKETYESYSNRVIYSALGLWCLKSAQRENDDIKGISKNTQTGLLRNLLNEYIELSPMTKQYLTGVKGLDIATFIRKIYEQMGYLITTDNNFNVLNNNGEKVTNASGDCLYLGIPRCKYNINGLGIYCNTEESNISVKDYLIRDDLDVDEYVLSKYNECDFYCKDIDTNELEFFNPQGYGVLSKCWQKEAAVGMTIARKNYHGPYYRVIYEKDGTYLFANEINQHPNDSMMGAEFLRLYAALKHYYKNPMQMLICPIDEKYSHIKILGSLPNREYFYLLMNAWPQKDFADRNNFIIKNNLVSQVKVILENIGFIIREGEFYG